MRAYRHLAFLAALVAVSTASFAQPLVVLQPIVAADWKAAGFGGTGCWWRARGDRNWRFAMADRTAVARIAGRVVVLEPVAGAPHAFPLTFDRWRAGSRTVRIVRTGRASRTGVEVMQQAARIEVLANGRRASYPGTLECGS